MSISRFGLCCPAPASQATVPPEIVKSQDVHAWKTRAQQDFIYVKFLPPIPCGLYAPTSKNAALPEGAVVLRRTFVVQTCEKTLLSGLPSPVVVRASGPPMAPHDTEE
ncbi:hypothetical protein C8J57DRAFT_1526838 [Mycena rebaudengoi]|nr:hypothetical protein C8J57DRAFT_1526838 [Mycena rebaudengoi]